MRIQKDDYDKPVVTLAILADQIACWKPDSFGCKLWGFETGIKFSVIKLLDYFGKWKKMEEKCIFQVKSVPLY